MRCGIVGAGRTRSGLGPFLARFVEAAGGRVVGIAGRDRERAERTAGELSGDLGHPVAAHDSAAALLQSGLDALVIATPDAAHLDGLRAAAAAGVPTLCEKPIVTAEQYPFLKEVLARFRGAGVLLVEQCQWPYSLGAFDELFPEAAGREPAALAMRLSPERAGGAGLRDSLSHFLSVIQARIRIDPTTEVAEPRFDLRGPGGEESTTWFTLRQPDTGAEVRCRLELCVCPQQPRPAWIEIDGLRMERVVDMSDYGISFVARGRTVSVGDPLRALVYRFVDSVRAPDIERTTAESRTIEQRARLYERIVHGFAAQYAWRCAGPDRAP